MIVYLSLNAIVVAVSLQHVAANPSLLATGEEALFTQHGSPVMMVAVALLVFPGWRSGSPGSRPAWR